MTSDATELSYPFGRPHKMYLDPAFAKLRTDNPVARVQMPYGGVAWMVTRYEDIKAVYGDTRFSRQATVNTDVPRIFPVVDTVQTLFTTDPPDHTRLRKSVARAFTPTRVAEMRKNTERIMEQLVDNLLESAQPADIADVVTWQAAITVICELLGVPLEDHVQFRDWTDTSLGLAPGHDEEILAARQSLQDYLASLIAQRREQPTDDMLGYLVSLRDEKDQLSEDELVSLGAVILRAGHETTANAMTCVLYLLLSRRDLWQELLDDSSKIPMAVEELLRYIPLGDAGFSRVATEDIEVGGHLIRAGETVIGVPASGNHDESVYPDAEAIDFSREHVPHLLFGYGVHHCLGNQLARLEITVLLETLTKRLPTLHLAVPDEDIPWRVDRLVRGPSALPVAW